MQSPFGVALVRSPLLGVCWVAEAHRVAGAHVVARAHGIAIAITHAVARAKGVIAVHDFSSYWNVLNPNGPALRLVVPRLDSDALEGLCRKRVQQPSAGARQPWKRGLQLTVSTFAKDPAHVWHVCGVARPFERRGQRALFLPREQRPGIAADAIKFDRRFPLLNSAKSTVGHLESRGISSGSV